MKAEVVKVVNLSKKFRKVDALKGVSLIIEEKEIFGLLGSNGAGKTTLLHILMGLLDYQGEVYFFGEKIKDYPRFLKNKVAIVPQKISLYDDLTIKDNLYFFGKAYGLKKEEVLERIEKLSDALKLGDLKRKVQELSGGFQRRVSIAVALIGNPEILILDEALVGIDLITKKVITDMLVKLKESKTIILTTHSILDAEKLCDSVCLLHKGENVLCGKTGEIIDKYSNKYRREVGLEEIMFKLIK